MLSLQLIFHLVDKHIAFSQNAGTCALIKSHHNQNMYLAYHKYDATIVVYSVCD